MCQLTFLSGDPAFVKAYLINLTLLNAADGNRDGFGIFEFPAGEIAGQIWRKDKDGSRVVLEDSFFDLLKEFTKPKLNIMSHVRAASRGFSVNPENTHPFRLDHLILAHNGTLDAEDKKLEIKDKIDSYWFLSSLAKIVGKKTLKEEHIVDAMKNFRGKFAFLIGDLTNPEILWVVRGKAPLHYTKVFLNEENGAKKEELFIINTDRNNMGRCLAPYFMKVVTGKDYTVENPTEFDEESIYQYNVETGSLVKTSAKITERSLIIPVGAATPYTPDDYYSRGEMGGYQHRFSGVTSSPYISDDTLLDKIDAMSIKYGLTALEINLAHRLLTNEPLVFGSPDTVKDVHDTLLKFDNSFTPAKLEVWNQIVTTYKLQLKKDPQKNGITVLDVYRDLKIKFPYFLHSKNELKNVLTRIEKRSFNRQKSSKSSRS